MDFKADIHSLGYFRPSRCVFENTAVAGNKENGVRCHENILIVRILKLFGLIVDLPLENGEIVHLNKLYLDKWLKENKCNGKDDRSSYNAIVDTAVQNIRLWPAKPEEKQTIAKMGVMSLFGDQADYEALPIFKIPEATKSFDSIQVNDLSAPKMRGTDLEGREFCVIRVKGNVKENNEQRCLVISQTLKNSSTWVINEPQGPVIKNSDALFTNGFRYTAAFDEIKELISSGKFDNWTVE